MMDTNGQQDTWAAVDWSDASHTVSIVDRGGKQLALFEVAHSKEGLDALCARLGQFKSLKEIEIETTRHLVVHQLLNAGFVVYCINPKLSAAWRKGWTVAGVKTDPLDAHVLAAGLAMHHERLEVFQPNSPLTRELALLCEDETTLIAERTAQVNRLKATLKLYFPAALDWFDDWTTSTSWDFILAFPTPQQLATASMKRLAGFFAVHHLGLGPKWQTRADQRRAATDLSADNAILERRLAVDKTMTYDLNWRIRHLFSTAVSG